MSEEHCPLIVYCKLKYFNWGISSGVRFIYLFLFLATDIPLIILAKYILHYRSGNCHEICFLEQIYFLL